MIILSLFGSPPYIGLVPVQYIKNPDWFKSDFRDMYVVSNEFGAVSLENDIVYHSHIPRSKYDTPYSNCQHIGCKCYNMHPHRWNEFCSVMKMGDLAIFSYLKNLHRKYFTPQSWLRTLWLRWIIFRKHNLYPKLSSCLQSWLS